MKNILVLYYSQTGQLEDILREFLSMIEKTGDVSITYEALTPRIPYPFPWSSYEFCDVFAESVAGAPCELLPLKCDMNKDYDLIILGYTVWYLSPCIPVASFLQSQDAHHLLGGRPVLTIIGCRNMWILAQEKIKSILRGLDARLCGNIVLSDRTGNLTGVLTIALWMLTGKKERFLGLLPKPGISDGDIKASSRFGPVIREAMAGDTFEIDQKMLNHMDAVAIDPALLIMEIRMTKIFSIWSAFIRKKGGHKNPARRKRVRAFFVYLIIAILVIAPAASLVARLIKKIKKDQLNAEIEYYLSNDYRESTTTRKAGGLSFRP